MIIKIEIIAAVVVIAAAVGWSWAAFGTQQARVKIANTSGNQVSSNQVPAPTQPYPKHSYPAQVSMKDWRFKVSPLSPHDNLRRSHGGWWLQFSLPQPTRKSQSAYFASATASPLLIQGWYVKVSGRASPLPPGMECRMYFSGSPSDDLSSQYQLWLSTKPLIPGANRLGDFVQFVGLEPEFWSTATGEPENWSNFLTGERGGASAAATAGFQQALANPQSIGIICGAYVRGDPFAGDSIPDPYAVLQFTMDSFAVCDPFAPSAKQQNEACAPPSAQQR
jgi:hypothetical protein